MARQLSPVASFVTGSPRLAEFGYLVLTLDELSQAKTRHSVLSLWVKGQFARIEETAWHTAGLAVMTQPQEHAVAVGDGGLAVAYGLRGYLVREQVATGASGPEGRGPLRGVRAIDNKVYAVGMDRQAYVRIAERNWQRIEQGLRGTPPGSAGGFESIDGYAANELYAVGWDGEIWQSDGFRWEQHASPTNVVLTDVCCAGDGSVYACGRRGLLLSGRGSSWRIIDQDVIGEDIWSLAWCGDALFLSTFDGVYAKRGDTIELVDMGDDDPATFYKVAAFGNLLWSIGAKDIMAYDGTAWTRID
jgi:hypothetical protein